MATTSPQSGGTALVKGSFTILYFAGASSFTGKASEQLQGPIFLKDLFGFLEAKYQGINKTVLRTSLVTVNLEYVDIEEINKNPSTSSIQILPGDEVAIIPPVSSG